MVWAMVCHLLGWYGYGSGDELGACKLSFVPGKEAGEGEEIMGFCMHIEGVVCANCQADRLSLRAIPVYTDHYEEIVKLRAEVSRLKAELKLAIAHDRQPYPTAEAYENVCELLRVAREDLEKGFMAGAYSRLKHLQESENIAVQLRAEISARDKCIAAKDESMRDLLSAIYIQIPSELTVYKKFKSVLGKTWRDFVEKTV